MYSSINWPAKILPTSENPIPPNDIELGMTVATLELPAYVYDPEDIKITVADNRRYTMRDIGKIEDRVENLEVVTSLIESDGVESSSVMVNVPVESLIVAFDALDNVIVTVSFASSIESSIILAIVIEPDVAPALIVSVPSARVKSVPEPVAVPVIA